MAPPVKEKIANKGPAERAPWASQTFKCLGIAWDHFKMQSLRQWKCSGVFGISNKLPHFEGDGGVDEAETVLTRPFFFGGGAGQ